jgi:hypothetical protein
LLHCTIDDVGGRHRRVKEKLCSAQLSGGAIYLYLGFLCSKVRKATWLCPEMP